MSSELNPDARDGYAAAVAELGSELRRFGTHELRTTRELDPAAFGRLGVETGFTTALTGFATRAAGAAAALSGRAAALAEAVRT